MKDCGWFVWVIIVMALIIGGHAYQNRLEAKSRLVSEISAEKKLTAFAAKVGQCGSVVCTVRKGRSEDDLLAQAGWDQSRFAPDEWAVLRQDISERNGFSDSHSWIAGDLVKVAKPWPH